MSEAEASVVRAAVALCRRQPELLSLPELAFFRSCCPAELREFADGLGPVGAGRAGAGHPAGDASPPSRCPPRAGAPAAPGGAGEVPADGGGIAGGGMGRVISPFNLGSLFTCEWSDDESTDEDLPPHPPAQPPQASDDDDGAAPPKAHTDPCAGDDDGAGGGGGEGGFESPDGDAHGARQGDDGGEQQTEGTEGSPLLPVATRAPVTEGAMLRSMELVGEAAYLSAEGQHARALSAMGDAIALNPGQALLYVERAELHLRMRKPNAAVRDCDHALRINPDSARAHKARGRAFRALKNWELAAHHLRLGNQLVYDDSAYGLQKRVESKVKERRIEEARQRLEAHNGGERP